MGGPKGGSRALGLGRRELEPDEEEVEASDDEDDEDRVSPLL